MRNQEENWLKNLATVEPPADLLTRSMDRILLEKRSQARVRLLMSALAALASAVLLVPALQFGAGELAASGLVQYLSLLVSDGGSVLASWSDFALTLANALPVLGLTVVLGSALALFGSVVLALRQLPRAFPGRLSHS